MKTEQELREYRKEYYEKNKEYFKHYNKKKREERKRNCIYRILDNENRVIYWGSTNDIYLRFYTHWDDNSSLLLKSNCEQYNYSHFEVSFLSDDINRHELYWIEDYLIESNDTLLNQACAYNEDNRKKQNIDIIDECRKIELQKIADNLKFKFYK